MKCEVVKDLLALYADDACSEQTKAEIKQHLEECETCSKALEEYQTELETPIVRDVDMDKVKPFKKVARRYIKISVATIILTLLVIYIPFWFIYGDAESYKYSHLKCYFQTEKQTKMLVNGDIDGFMENVTNIRELSSYSMKNVNYVLPDAKDKVQELYDNYLKGKKTEIKIYGISDDNLNGFGESTGVTALIETSDKCSLEITYFWANNTCALYFTVPSSNKNSDLDRFVYAELNPLIFISTHVPGNSTEYFNIDKNQAIAGLFNDNVKGKNNSTYKNQLTTRLDNLKKSAKFVSVYMDNFNYDIENKQILFDYTFIVQDLETGKQAVMRQTFIRTDKYVPKSDAQFIVNEGVSKDVEEQLLNLF